MKNRILTLTVLSATSLTFLTACGLDLDNKATPTFLSDPVAAVTDGVASFSNVGFYNNGGTAQRNGNGSQTNATRADDTRDYTYNETQDTFNVEADNDTIIMTVNGAEYVLTARQNDENQWYSGDDTLGASLEDHNTYSSGNNSIIDIIAGNADNVEGTYLYYHTDTTDYYSGASNFNLDYTFGAATVGIQTPASVVSTQTATATYDGTIRFSTLPYKTTTRNDPYRKFYAGGLSMEVDFTTNTVEGTADVREELSGDSGNITFASAPIIGNGFQSTFTLDNALRADIGLTNNPTGNYAGNFFGPAADDLAGVMRINGTSADGFVIGYGGFRGDRQISE